MRFAYFTDIHLCQGSRSKEGFERCLQSMLGHDPDFLVNGGDLGITEEAVDFYNDVTRDLPVPLFLSNGNHEMCSGYLPREKAGTVHSSVDIGGVHLVVIDVVRYIEPEGDRKANWYGLADAPLIEWLKNDLAGISTETPVILASHIPLSTTFPNRMGQIPGSEFPTNEIANAGSVLPLLEKFANVATLHGHDHENCRHYLGNVEIMTTAAVSGNWWREGWDSRISHSREPQGYRLVEVSDKGRISSKYFPFAGGKGEPAELLLHEKTGNMYVNVFDGSPRTLVTAGEMGDLPIIDPLSESCRNLCAHLYALPEGFNRKRVEVDIAFENGDVHTLLLEKDNAWRV